MYALLVPSLVSAVLGAQILLSLALLKGDICPGQRGRFHHAFWVPTFSWLILVPSSFLAILPFLFLGIFAFRSKTGKTRRSGPIPLLHVANLLGFVAWITILSTYNGWMVALGVLQLILLGASLGHCLLVRARSRLQAFDRLLPLVSVLALMGLMVLTGGIAAVNQATAMSLNAIVAGAGFGLLGVAALTWHLLKQTSPVFWRLVTGVGFMLMANISLTRLLIV
ncbi:hypothetical protein [Salinivibrio sp. ES.052]|uniref:hypothetical protein n=1 Tax=Salinivibrio sp. ES.052 TaxID=1882823 RepID=UPI00092ABF51|nr:hypothetical protein [Salinivibrio sp. ES.052]SIN82225.1 hypothetical protein SAMN05444724_0710 [Salinivibrio sp. ES.052]